MYMKLSDLLVINDDNDIDKIFGDKYIIEFGKYNRE